MILKNKTTNKTVCKDLKICSSFIDQLFGLLLPSNPRNLLFKTRFGIHTFFLKNAIDIVVLDEDMKVRVMKQDLDPNKLFFWNPRYFWVLELPKGTIKTYKIKPDDIFSIN